MGEIIDNSERYQQAVAAAEEAGKHDKRRVFYQTENTVTSGTDLFGNPIRTRIVSQKVDTRFRESTSLTQSS